MSNLTVHQPSHSRYSLGVALAVVAVSLPQALVAAHTQDGVFHHYAALGKGRVVSYVFGWARLVMSSGAVLVRSSWLSTRCETQLLRVEGGYAYICDHLEHLKQNVS